MTKPGGYLYTVYGLVGGVFEDAIWPSLRQFYRENQDFKGLIDQLKPEDFYQFFQKIMTDMKKYTGETGNLSAFSELLDVDFCVFIQNALQAPIRLKIPEEFIRKHYEEQGFTEIRRLRRYVKRTNLRKYFAPLHYDRDYPLSRILYGTGNLEFIARKQTV